MSDFLVASRPLPRGRLAGMLERYLAPAGVTVREWHGPWGSLAVAAAPHQPDPVLQDGAGLTVLVGEPLARGPSGTGNATGRARRLELHAELLRGAPGRWDQRLDGPFAALALPASGGGRVLTDLFAWVPVFGAEAAGGKIAAGTHVDAVARLAGSADDVDLVSAAELVAYFVCTYPHTLYPAVRQLPPASLQCFGPGGWAAAEPYWVPRETVAFGSLAEAAETLREALLRDVALACEGLDEAGLLLSGGEDARAVLGAVPRGVRVRTFTYTEAENREVRAARRAARAFGADHTFVRRPPGHDLRYFQVVARLIGSHNQFIDVHNYGIHAALGLPELPVVLGGFSSDALVKGDNVRGAALRRARRGLPPEPRRIGVPRLPGMRRELLEAAAARRGAYLDQLRALRPLSAEEWLYLYPFSMRKYAANFHGSRRLFRSHEPFQSNPVVQLAASVPQGWKVDRRLFHRAVRPLLRSAWWVPHSRNRMPYFSHRANAAALRPLLGAARDLRDLLLGARGGNQESWPDWSELVARPEATAAFAEFPLRDSRAGDLLEGGAGEEALHGWPPLRRLAALQLAFTFAAREDAGPGGVPLPGLTRE